MKNGIAARHPDAQGELMAHAVDACVHCGFCLPACPTYRLLGDEMDSPRGRIVLMKEVLEGELPLYQATPHLDRCLGCAACVTACPSGVPYGELITAFRGWSEPQRARPMIQRLTRAAVLSMLPRPPLFRAAATLGRFAKPLAPALPQALRAPLDLLPESVPPAQPTPAFTPARGARRGRVALLTGCAQQVLTPEFNAATVRVLSRNGIEVTAPEGQGCCGAAAMHTGARALALEQARRNLAAFAPGAAEGEVDAIISNAAGCGAGLKEYPVLLAGEPGAQGAQEAQRAQALAGKVQDISVYLAGLSAAGGLEPFMPTRRPLRVAYHDACHLAHAQGVRAEPRALIASIPGVTLLEVPEGDLCCGSAGTYNLEQPQLAGQLGDRKARNVLSTRPDIVVSGNVGCHTQLQSHLARLHALQDGDVGGAAEGGEGVRVMHLVELLDLAYRGEL